MSFVLFTVNVNERKSATEKKQSRKKREKIKTRRFSGENESSIKGNHKLWANRIIVLSILQQFENEISKALMGLKL